MSTTHREHQYQVSVEWTGNEGTGTSDYKAYKRDHLVSSGEKPAIQGSSDPAFRGIRNDGVLKNSLSPRSPLVISSGICTCAP